MRHKKYFVIIPVHNEQRHILKLLNRVHDYTKNIIVVNDGSTDQTENILKKISFIKLFNLPTNQGKGMAMRYGAELAWKLKAEGIVFLDGDNQHNPSHLPSFFAALKKGINIVIGIRILKADVPYYRKIGNMVLISAVKLLFNISLPDLLCGYRGMSKKGYKQILWRSNGYGVETEMIALIGQKRINFESIIVDTIYYDKYKGFSIKDGLVILCKLPFWKISNSIFLSTKHKKIYTKNSHLFSNIKTKLLDIL